ncbi:MAG: 50S ribosomal protein L22 [Candidatus Bilamarchaeaceae archaeon]
MGYSCEIENEADFAKARVEGVNASYKDLAAVCYNIRKRGAENAVAFLEKASEGKQAIKYPSRNKKMGHRRELGGRKGRWPAKEAGIVLKCLKSAIANAREKGLSEELIVMHASANKKRIYMRYAPKGRRNVSKMETARVEIVLREKAEAKRKRMDEAKKEATPVKAVVGGAPPAAPATQKAAPAAPAPEAKPTPLQEIKEVKPKSEGPAKAAAKPRASKKEVA